MKKALCHLSREKGVQGGVLARQEKVDRVKINRGVMRHYPKKNRVFGGVSKNYNFLSLAI
jgi:hypothetical protein